MEERLSTTNTEKIRASLTGKTTGLTSGEIRDLTGITKKNAIPSALFVMQMRGEVIKHKGESPGKSRYSLNPEKIVDAPPRRRKAAKKPGRKAGKTRQARRPAVPEPRAADREFVPAITSDAELVLCGAGRAPQFFTPEQTVAIATLLAANFG